MSVPRTLELPDGVIVTSYATARGTWAAHECRSGGPVRGTALLVPGFTGSKEDFDPILPLLADRGWATVAVDQLGQFQSSAASGPDAYALDLVAHDVADLLAAVAGAGFTPPMHLLGHSYGGLVTRAAVLADAPAASLTLLASGPAALPDATHDRLQALRAALPVRTLDEIFSISRALDREAGLPASPPQIEAFERRRFTATDAAQLDAAAVTLMTATDRVHELAAGGTPVAVICGDVDDAWSPQEQIDMAARLGVDAVVLPGIGHSPAIEDPESTAAALDAFWSRITPAR